MTIVSWRHKVSPLKFVPENHGAWSLVGHSVPKLGLHDDCYLSALSQAGMAIAPQSTAQSHMLFLTRLPGPKPLEFVLSLSHQPVLSREFYFMALFVFPCHYVLFRLSLVHSNR